MIHSILAFFDSWSWWLIGSLGAIGLFGAWVGLSSAWSWGAEDAYHARLMGYTYVAPDPPKLLTQIFWSGFILLLFMLLVAAIKFFYVVG